MAGEILREKREGLGLEIHEVAESLKISEEFLAAIENDVFEKLPVPVYTTGYIRCYAALVGVDADPIVQFYREHLSQPKPSTIIPIAFSQKKNSRLVYLLAALVLAVAAFLLFPYVPKERGENPVPSLPAAEKVSGGGPAASGLPSTNAAQRKTSGGVAVPAGNADLSGKALAAGRHNLSIVADDTTWISVTFDNGRKEQMLLRPGQSKDWPFSGTAFLTVGNAGGVNVKLDGKDLGKPGRTGQVRNMTLPAKGK